MQFERLEIPDIVKISLPKFHDDRGYFSETFRADKLSEFLGQTFQFVQENLSRSNHAFTVRGLHFQAPPHAQGKLVTCMRGAILDVAVDIRTGSETYGKYVAAELTAETGAQLWVPPGFLHGFVTLKDHTDVLYKCTNYYSPAHEGSILWNDKDIGIDWPFDNAKAILSDKDSNAPLFKDFSSPF